MSTYLYFPWKNALVKTTKNRVPDTSGHHPDSITKSAKSPAGTRSGQAGQAGQGFLEVG